MNENRTSGIAPASNRKDSAEQIAAQKHNERELMDHDEHEENEHKLFSLKEAERARREIEPVLIEAMENRGKVAELDEQLSAVANRILMMGGITIDYESVARVRSAHNRLLSQIKDALDRIHATGCVVKDLDAGLLDFPAILKNEEVYLCWRVGEDRIRFYHRQDEGFAGRKPLDPRDLGSGDIVQ
jgi:hypothetical protein